MGEATRHRNILGIGESESISEELIRSNYRRLINIYHPDRAAEHQVGEFTRRTQEINQARDYLLSHPRAWIPNTPRPTTSEPTVSEPVYQRSTYEPVWEPRVSYPSSSSTIYENKPRDRVGSEPNPLSVAGFPLWLLRGLGSLIIGAFNLVVMGLDGALLLYQWSITIAVWSLYVMGFALAIGLVVSLIQTLL